MVAWLRLLRVVQKVGRTLTDDLKRWDLNLAQFDVLARVGGAEGLTQQDLAEALLVTKGNVCQMLDRLPEARASGAASGRPGQPSLPHG